MEKHFLVKTNPIANNDNVILGEKYRITILTSRLFRLEYSKEGIFEDRATQMVWNRDFPKVKYTLQKNKSGIKIQTDDLKITFNGKEPSNSGLKIELNSLGKVYKYGDEISNLYGTARTLDNVNGSNVTLSNGIMSRDGIAILEDKSVAVLKEDGWIDIIETKEKDLYFFCYGHDYLSALKDFYYLCSKTPLIPRYALGNWWSRYYKYTQKEYLSLMDKFKEKNIPLSVAVIDMDWHLVDIDKKYGSGWTGFTWNNDFFPDPVEFMRDLHSRGMKVTLNLHPASGIRGYEKAYPTIAKHMGVDIKNEEPVTFDVTSEKFMKYYYKDVLNPHEEDGVDFWWVDWQQGKKSNIENLDPLWMLNHYDYLDSGKKGRRPITFSRYAETGSHRYPIGFSGDTFVTWETLDFQPYFTTIASNIGYGWWSHDIGGHMRGYKDNELMTRWVQFAVFSPILRLHSTCNKFNSKEPWKYGPEAETIMSSFLRMRHKMVPYLYNMNYRAYKEDKPICMPLYYIYPEKDEAYRYKNEYFFGDSMLVCPITTKRIFGVGLSKVNVYLPEGKWYDIFKNRVYEGNRELTMYRGLDSIPAFVKFGTILPLTDSISANDVLSNPREMHINIYLGNDKTYELYEDDGVTDKYLSGKYVKTQYSLVGNEKDNTIFVIDKANGELSLLPKKRDYLLDFYLSKDMTEKVKVLVDGKEFAFEYLYDEEKRNSRILVKEVPVNKKLEVKFASSALRIENNLRKDVFDLIDSAELRYDTKETLYKAAFFNSSEWGVYNEMSKTDASHDMIQAILEILHSNPHDKSYLKEAEK